MKLFYTELLHLLLSIIIASIIYVFIYQSYLVFVFSIIWGFLIDLDHIIDFWLKYPFSFNLKDFFTGKQFKESWKAYILFHSWEYVIVWIIIFFWLKDDIKYLVLSLICSLFMHIILDIITNKSNFTWYSIVNRIYNKFDLRVVCKK